jgi:hypothetical protein
MERMGTISDMEVAMWDREQLGLHTYGPLTREEAEKEAKYEAFMQEEADEYDAREAAGGRTVCPACGNRTVTHTSVCTLGYPGHPGAEFSDFERCEACDWSRL